MAHPVSTLRGPTHRYTAHGFDWRPVFHELAHGCPPPTVKDVAEHWELPYATVRRHWVNYQAATAAGDETALAIACGDVDGRRDNRRVFNREEEQLLRERIDEENIDPNKPVIQRLALAIHHQQHLSSSPAKSTRSRALPTASFSAGSSFVERVKHDLHLSSQKAEIEKRYKRKRAPEDDEERLSMAIEFIDDVARSVLRNGARMVINADELSAKVIKPPHTVLAPAGTRHSPRIPSNRSEKEAFTMIFATTASGAKLKPAVVISERGPRAMQAFAHLTPHVHVLMGHRWFGDDMWARYIIEVIVPYCAGAPATFIVDSSPVHLTDFSVDTAMEHDVCCVQVPPRMTATLQPNDVKVYGPLSSAVRSMWVNQVREEPEVYDSLALAIERYLCAWRSMTRENVQHAWREANPLLQGLRNQRAQQPEQPASSSLP